MTSLHRRLGRSLMGCPGASPRTGGHSWGRPPLHGGQIVGSYKGKQGVAVCCAKSGVEAQKGGWFEGEIMGLTPREMGCLHEKYIRT